MTSSNCHPAVEALAVVHGRYIAGEYVIDKFECLRTLDIDFAHVRYVEQADAGADSAVLRVEAFVLDRHVVAGEWRHLCSESAVAVVQACSFDFSFHEYRSVLMVLN